MKTTDVLHTRTQHVSPQTTQPASPRSPVSFSSQDTMAAAQPDPMAELLNISNARKIAPIEMTSPQATASIPLFDLDEIDKAPSEVRKQLITNLYNGLRDVGFIAIKADKIKDSLPKVYDQTKTYFAQPLEVKIQHIHGNFGQSGYVPKSTEIAQGAKAADLKEFFHIPPSMEKWPENMPIFRPIMEQYHKDMSSYMEQLIIYLMEHFGEDSQRAAKDMQDPANLVRLIYYPPHNESDPVNAVRSAAHYDLNLLTLLPAGTAPGLELLTKDGKWTPVVIPDGYIIVNTGDQIERWTGGIIKATKHRVITPEGADTKSDRTTAVFFGTFSNSFVLNPLKTCVELACANMNAEEKENFLKKYPDVTVEQFRTARLIEIGHFKAPPKELVDELRGLGLLKEPTETIKDLS